MGKLQYQIKEYESSLKDGIVRAQQCHFSEKYEGTCLGKGHLREVVVLSCLLNKLESIVGVKKFRSEVVMSGHYEQKLLYNGQNVNVVFQKI